MSDSENSVTTVAVEPIKVNKEGLFTLDNSTPEEQVKKAQADALAKEGADVKETEKAETVEEPKKDPFAPKFAALTRLEKKMKAKEKSLAEREKQIEARLAELEAKNKPAEEPKKQLAPLEERLKRDFFGTLKEQGYDFETMTKMALADGKPTPEMQLQLIQEDLRSEYKKEVEALRAQMEQQSKEQAEREATKEQERHNQVIQGFKQQIQEEVSKDPVKYELINAEGAYDLVFEIIDAYHAETKEVLDIQTAADKAEEFLNSEISTQAKKYLKLSKINKLIEAEKPQPEQKTDKKPSVTLSNTQTQVVPTNGARRLKSKEESLADAAKVLKWKA